MPTFVFKFQSLLEYRRNRRELCLVLMAQLLADDSSLADHRASLEDARRHQLRELRNLGLAGEVNVDRSAARRFYSGQLVGDIRLVERQRKVVTEQVELCRKAFFEVDRQVKVLEKLREKHFEQFQSEQARRETRELEDAWLAARATGYAK